MPYLCVCAPFFASDTPPPPDVPSSTIAPPSLSSTIAIDLDELYSVFQRYRSVSPAERKIVMTALNAACHQWGIVDLNLALAKICQAYLDHLEDPA